MRSKNFELGDAANVERGTQCVHIQPDEFSVIPVRKGGSNENQRFVIFVGCDFRHGVGRVQRGGQSIFASQHPDADALGHSTPGEQPRAH